MKDKTPVDKIKFGGFFIEKSGNIFNSGRLIRIALETLVCYILIHKYNKHSKL